MFGEKGSTIQIQQNMQALYGFPNISLAVMLQNPFLWQEDTLNNILYLNVI